MKYSYSVSCTKLTKSNNSCQKCQILMATKYDELRMVASNSTKFEQNL